LEFSQSKFLATPSVQLIEITLQKFSFNLKHYK